MNPYIKQFPELFKGKKVLYVHGFGSSGQSGTVTRIREVLPNAVVIAPDLPIHPEEAIDLLRRTCVSEHPDLIIGTSMGGMYTEMLYGYDRILVNPALQMGDTMKDHGMIGAQHFSNPRQDGVQDFIVTKAMVKEYKEMTEQCFSGITDEEQKRVWGLFGDEDTTVNTFDLFHEHYPTAIRFHGEHRMNDNSFMHSVVPVIRWVDDRQEGRERPIIYIDINTLRDKWGKPNSSSPISCILWLLLRLRRGPMLMSMPGSMSMSTYQLGDIPSLPIRNSCFMAITLLIWRRQREWRR